MRSRNLILSVALLAVALPLRAQRPANVDAGANAPRRGALAGVGPFARFSPRADESAQDASVEFLPGKSELTVKSRLLLDEMAGVVQRDATMRVVIVRPAGVVGAEAILSTQRADVTRAYLTARGVAVYRITLAAKSARAGSDDSSPNAKQQGEELRVTIVPDPAPTQP